MTQAAKNLRRASVSVECSRRGRGVAATRLRKIRAAKDPEGVSAVATEDDRVASDAAATPQTCPLASRGVLGPSDDPRGTRGVAATRPFGRPACHPSPRPGPSDDPRGTRDPAATPPAPPPRPRRHRSGRRKAQEQQREREEVEKLASSIGNVKAEPGASKKGKGRPKGAKK